VALSSLEEACEGCDSPPSNVLQNEWRLACNLPCAIMTCTRTVRYDTIFFTSALVYDHPHEDMCWLTGDIFIDVTSASCQCGIRDWPQSHLIPDD